MRRFRLGKIVRVGDIPPEAQQNGGLNEAPDEETRSPEPVNPDKLDRGPDIQDGTYRPAKYKTPKGNIRIDA